MSAAVSCAVCSASTGECDASPAARAPYPARRPPRPEIVAGDLLERRARRRRSGNVSSESTRSRGRRSSGLTDENHEFVQIPWDEVLPPTPARRWGGTPVGSRLVTSHVEHLHARPHEVFAPIRRIGGTNRWYAADWFWRLRGWLDQLRGGDGLRRGRRDPHELRVGDALKRRRPRPRPRLRRVRERPDSVHTELLAYFDEPTTNGYAEGVINKVKVIKRRAYGSPTVAGFRKRVVIACG
jgi:Transposase